MKKKMGIRPVTDAQELRKRKRYLMATLVTCLAVAMIFGALHVVKLGANRMADMRNKATYPLEQEAGRIRAAGEDSERYRVLFDGDVEKQHSYSVAEVEALLDAEHWTELETMVHIPAGTFLMGTDQARSSEQNKPQHQVYLDEYVIDKYPVTNIQYARFVAATGHPVPLDWDGGRIPSGKLMDPVTMVSWYDAVAYATWAGKRLPTESEWEKAARGTDGRRWPWGNVINPDKLNTYYNIGSTTDVTRYADGASPYGVMDMAGNVSEWTATEFLPYPDSQANEEIFDVRVPLEPDTVDKSRNVTDFVKVEGIRYIVVRSGSWKSDPFSTATYHRNFSLPKQASNFYGFRCAADKLPVASKQIKQ